MARDPAWLWPNLLSLDAPLIAVVWQDFLSRSYAVPLRLPGRVALFLTVWAIYLGDRLLDARQPPVAAEPARHSFYRRHRAFAPALLAIVLAADALVTFGWLRPAIVVNGLIPFAAVLLYLGVLHVVGARIAKEPVVAFLFTAGTFLVAWTNDPASPIALLWPAAAFFALCLANLIAIESWEWRELRAEREPAHPLTRALARSIHVWAIALAVLALVFGHSPWYRAIALSAAAISGLVLVGRALPLELRRVLVDVALLTPLLWAPR
jgi:hypothetical protein